jgi:hypothetical protein
MWACGNDSRLITRGREHLFPCCTCILFFPDYPLLKILYSCGPRRRSLARALFDGPRKNEVTKIRPFYFMS